MKILITGANGFVGRNLVASLEAIRDGKDRTRNIKSLDILTENVIIYTYDINSTPEELDNYCSDCVTPQTKCQNCAA